MTTALTCLVPLLAISSQSFWIDEALTGLKAAQPSLVGWWHEMSAEKLSDLQMPLYMIYAWAWAKVFGTGEWILRAANLPWFIGGVLALVCSFRGPGRLWAAIIATLSSFAWFYLDEARPYAMQLGASLLVAAAIRQLATPEAAQQKSANWVRAFCVGFGALAGANLLGVFWCGAALACLVVAAWPRQSAPISSLELNSAVSRICSPHGEEQSGPLPKAIRRCRRIQFCATRLWQPAPTAWASLGLWLLGLAVYYAWTIKVGARASAMATTNWQSAVFIGYELLGFSGLGPGRLEIRDAGLRAFGAHALPLALYGLCLSVIAGLALVRLYRRDRRRLFSVGIVVLGTLAVLLLAAWASHFRLLGRHCAPAFAAVVLLLSAGATEAWLHTRRWPKVLLIGFLLATLASCLSARFAERHHKDDYRAVAAFAEMKLRTGKRVWWSADFHGAQFYGLPISTSPETKSPMALWIPNPKTDSLNGLASPDIVVCSKPDLYDVNGVLAQRLAQEQFQPVARFTAFTVWARRP